MQTSLYIPTESAMLAFGRTLAKVSGNEGGRIYLCGNLGAGKTTLVRGFLQGLGYKGRVKSPTYTLIEPYAIDHKSIYHCDFYRISQAAELIYLGLEEYLAPPDICLIEWPDLFLDQLPVPDILIHLSLEDQGRQLQMETKTPCGKVIMERFLQCDLT